MIKFIKYFNIRIFFEYISSAYKKGIGRTLLIRFLFIAIVPMAIIGIVSIQSGTSSIKHNRSVGLAAVAKAKHAHLMEYFESTKTNLQLQAELNSTVQFLKSLKKSYQESNKSLKKFTASYQWASIEDEFSEDLNRFDVTFNYIDALLIDEKGNVLYSVRQRDDLGRNLFSGKYSGSKLSAAAKKAIKTGKPVFTDMEKYSPYKNKVSSFLIQSIIDEYGDKIGLLAVHLSIESITNIMKESSGYGVTGDTYLVGLDMLMRSNSRFNKKSSILKTKVETLPVKKWLESLKKKKVEVEKKADVNYINYRNVEVLGVNIPVELAGVPMLMLAEIDVSEAYLPAQELMEIVIIIALIIVFLITIYSVVSVKKITHPITQITQWAKELAAGNLMQKHIKTADNEIGVLNLTFTELVKSLQDVTWVMEAFSVGDLSNELKSRSESDVLVMAINQLSSSMKSVVKQANEVAQGEYSRDFLVRGERDELGGALANMTLALREATRVNQKQDWLKSGQTGLASVMRGEMSLDVLGNKVISYLCQHLSANVGLFYVVEKEKQLNLHGSYACNLNDEVKKQYQFSQGMVGQCAVNKKVIVLTDLPNSYMQIESGIGFAQPQQLIILPLLYNEKVFGVIELAFLHETSEEVLGLLEIVHESMAIVINTIFSRVRIDETLLEVQTKSEALQAQQEELKASNEELEEQSQMLRQSEEELKAANEELEEKTKILAFQKEAVEDKNKEVEIKAEELAAASTYKSEFLANMSHELRTPLNSLLILAKMLHDNKEGNLSERQMEWARVISNSGTDLLELINDILDLSKVEAGKMTVDIEIFNIDTMVQSIADKFEPLANEKGIKFIVDNQLKDVHEMQTDSQRLAQILKNFLSNAVKFTEKGEVVFSIFKPDENSIFSSSHLQIENTLAISVADSGIGIAKEKLEAIFNAFQQEDGSTSRKYGGTGLGLSISKELARLLGGEINVQSEQGKGCVFTLYLPYEYQHKQESAVNLLVSNSGLTDKQRNAASAVENTKMADVVEIMPSVASFIADDRAKFSKTQKSVLIVEDHEDFALSLLELVRAQNYLGLVAGDGRSGIKMVAEYNPTAILLDLGLPDMSGEEVLRYVKNHIEMRHIPVHIISGREKDNRYLQLGAVGFLNKPVDEASIEKLFERINEIVDAEIKTILLVEDNQQARIAISALLENDYTRVLVAKDVKTAKTILESEKIDCLLLDLGLPDNDGVSFIKDLKDQCLGSCPVIIHTGRDLNDDELKVLNTAADSVIIKGAKSHERLLDETMLFLHHVDSKLPKQQRSVIQSLHDPEEAFKNKNILLVDDDMRNLFALSGLLSEHGMQVIMAENGEDALHKLEETKDIDLILMDVMMPVMDGYEAMSEIRKNSNTHTIPIICLTAKAMPEDRVKCIDAGASDYLAKPIDTDKLLSLMRVWLHQ